MAQQVPASKEEDAEKDAKLGVHVVHDSVTLLKNPGHRPQDNTETNITPHPKKQGF